jgi:hypothetical protein
MVMDTDKKFYCPTNLSSFEEYGFVWKADLENGVQIWIQTSKDSTHPKWIRLGDLLEINYINDPKIFQKTISSMLDSLK